MTVHATSGAGTRSESYHVFEERDFSEKTFGYSRNQFPFIDRGLWQILTRYHHGSDELVFPNFTLREGSEWTRLEMLRSHVYDCLLGGDTYLYQIHFAALEEIIRIVAADQGIAYHEPRESDIPYFDFVVQQDDFRKDPRNFLVVETQTGMRYQLMPTEERRKKLFELFNATGTPRAYFSVSRTDFGLSRPLTQVYQEPRWKQLEGSMTKSALPSPLYQMSSADGESVLTGVVMPELDKATKWAEAKQDLSAAGKDMLFAVLATGGAIRATSNSWLARLPFVPSTNVVDMEEAIPGIWVTKAPEKLTSRSTQKERQPTALARQGAQGTLTLQKPRESAGLTRLRNNEDPQALAVFVALGADLTSFRESGTAYIRRLQTWLEGFTALAAVQRVAMESMGLSTTTGLEANMREQLGGVMQDIGRRVDWGSAVGIAEKGMNGTLSCLWNWPRHLPQGVSEGAATPEQINYARTEAIGHGPSGRGTTLVGRLSLVGMVASGEVREVSVIKFVMLASLPQLMSYDAVGRLLIESRIARDVLNYQPLQDGLERELPAFFGVDMGTILGWSRAEYEQRFKERYEALWQTLGPRLPVQPVETAYRSLNVATSFGGSLAKNDPTEALRNLAAYREVATRWTLAHGAEQEAMGRVLEALILATFISQYAESFYNIDYDLPSGWDEARLDQELWRVMMDQVRELDRVLAGLEEGAQLPEALHGEDVLFFLPGNMRTVLEGSRSGNFVQPEDEVIIRRVLGRWEIFLPDESR